jgi:1,4-dihydroxy-2-naphthoate octaprenyltransferase
VAVLIMLVVWINQFQDLAADEQVGKNTWVVRLAGKAYAPDGSGPQVIRYERPFKYYTAFNIFSFAFIAAIGLLGFVKPSLGTPFVLISLLPAVLVYYAVRWGREWMEAWNQPEADRTKLPYELLKVNISTIGVHLMTGLLLVLGYWLDAAL